MFMIMVRVHMVVGVSTQNFFLGVICTKYNVIHILSNRIWSISGFCSLLTGWPAGSAVKHAGLRGEWLGFESHVGHFVFFCYISLST